jgi:hypothetical protein
LGIPIESWSVFQSRVWELNPRPTAYKAVALPLS